MLDSIIEFSIKNKIVVFLFVIGLIGWGGYSLSRLPIDAIPDITNNQVQIITQSPNLAAQEVEQLITFPLEMSLSNMPGLIELRSMSRFGLSVITAVFEDETDVYLARQMVNERLQIAKELVPPEFGTPTLAPVTTGLGEIYQYALTTKPGYEHKYDAMALREIQDWVVKRGLLGAKGVADVSSFGGYLKQYEIAVDPDKMRNLQITFAQIFDALKANHENTGGAYIEKGSNSYFIRGVGFLKSLDEIAEIPVRYNENSSIKLGQVADVRLGHATRYGAMTRNGKGETVGGIVMMLKGENSAKVITEVKKRMAEIEANGLPEGVKIEPFLDRSRLVDRAIHTVESNLLEGGLIVVFILTLMLGNLRAGFVAASVIPLALLFAVSMMQAFGVSGNLMSLGAIDFGLVVDGSLIIVESIVHRLHNPAIFGDRKRLPQAEMDEITLDQSKRIRKSAAFGEIIILVVYLPLLTLSGVEGKMFAPMAQTVSFAILGALILSMTYVPAVSALALNSRPSHKKNISDRIVDFLQAIYRPAFHLALRRGGWIVGGSVGALAGAMLLFNTLGGEFIPELDEGDFAVEMAIMPGSSLKQAIETGTKIEKVLLANFPEVRQVVCKIGTSEIPTDPMPIERADVMIILKDKDQWVSAKTKSELIAKMEAVLANFPGASFSFQQPIQMRFNELMTGAKTAIAIQFYGENLDTLSAVAEKTGRLIHGVEGAKDIYVEKTSGLPQIVVEYKQDQLARFGLTKAQVNAALRTSFAGTPAGQFYEGERRFDIVVRLNHDWRIEPSQVEQIYIELPSSRAGQHQIPLGQVASVKLVEGPMQISHDKTQRRITVGLNVRERDVESVIKDIQREMSLKMRIPKGYYVHYGGEFENLQQASRRLSVAVPVALALIFALLYFTLHSVKQAAIIFTAIPLAAVGGVLALWLRDLPFSISAGVGFIALFGVAVLNGLVLIGYFNELAAKGHFNALRRVTEGSRARLRPVVMTALVASLGFLPMALSQGSGAEVQRPLATVVIGGLITSTLLTLFVLPVLYLMTHREKKSNQTGGGVTKTVATATALVVLACLSLSVSAQNAPTTLNFEQALALAKKNNGLLRAADLNVAREQALKKAAFQPGKTQFQAQYGNIQFPNLNDFTVGAAHTLQWPSVYARQKQLTNANIQIVLQEKVVLENDILYQLKNLFNEIGFRQRKIQFLVYEDSLYGRFAEGTEKRLKAGDVSPLEALTAETRKREAANKLEVAKDELEAIELELSALLQTKEAVKFLGDLPEPNIADTAFGGSSPKLELLNRQITAAEAKRKATAAEKLPEISVGYMYQSFEGVSSGNVVQGGVNLPLYYGAYKAKEKAAKLEKESLTEQLTYETQHFEKQLSAARLRLQSAYETALYYQKDALPLANRMAKDSETAYLKGEAEYTEFLLNLTQALQIRQNYLDVLLQFHLLKNEAEWLSGSN